MAALDAVGDYETDPNVMMEDVPQDTRHRLEDSEGVECMCLQPAATTTHHTVRTEIRYCKQAGGSRSLTHADGPLWAALLKTYRSDALAAPSPLLLPSIDFLSDPVPTNLSQY